MTEGIAKELVLKKLVPRSEVPFPIQEFNARHRRIRDAMSKAGVDVLYLSAPESMFYVSGYQSEWYQAQSPKDWQPMSGIAMHVDHPGFILFDIVEELVMSRYTTISKDTRIYPEGTATPMHRWVVHELEKQGWTPSTVGLETWSYRPNRAVSEMFEMELRKAGCEVTDATDIVRSIRGTKSERELACIEKAAKIADVGLKAVESCMTPGMTELEVYGEIVRAMAKAGGENPGITMPVVSGPKCACVHALASRKKIRKGEVVNVDLCGVYKRYHVNMARTYSMGKPHPEVESVVAASARAVETLRGIIEPGLPVAKLVDQMREHYTREGIVKDSWWYGGYELGIAFPPDWVGAFFYDNGTDNRGKVFGPGTVVNYESIFYLPRKIGVSVVINTLLFGNKRAKVLGSIPNDILVLGKR